MTVELSTIHDQGKVSGERIVIKAVSADDMVNYAIFQGLTSNNSVRTGNVPHAYWFASQTVNPGDFVVVYTKTGTRGEKKNSDGTFSYFFYWGLSEPLWVPGYSPVLVTTSSWKVGKAIK